MPRPLRYPIAGVPQHVVQRGNNRGATFFSDEDRRFYLACLLDASRRHGLAIHAYVLMTNHVHLLATPARSGSVGRTLQSVGRRYVQVVNLGHGRTGTLWEGRHRASVVQSERYLAVCHAYVELNPVRAGLVSDPGEHPWSSCPHYTLGRSDPLVTDSPAYLASASTDAERRALHRAALEAGIDAGRLDEIRQQTARGGVIGDAAFRGAIAIALDRPVPGRSRGRPRRAAAGEDPDAIAPRATGPDLFDDG